MPSHSPPTPSSSPSSSPPSSSSVTLPSPSPSSTLTPPASPIPLDDLYLDILPKRNAIFAPQKHSLVVAERCLDVDMPQGNTTVVNSDADYSDASPLSRRPQLPLRQTSYSKRHASFDTPREVPLPRMMVSPIHQATSLSGHNSELDLPSTPTSEHPLANECSSESASSDDTSTDLSRSTSISSEQSPDLAKEEGRFDQLRDLHGDRNSGNDFLESAPRPHTGSSPVMPNSRPFSAPDPKAFAQSHHYAPQPTPPNWTPDRSSTASLPLLTSTPYHTLPSIPQTTLEESLDSSSSIGAYAESGPSSRRSPPPIPRTMYSSRTEPLAGMGQSDLPTLSRCSSAPYDSIENSFSLPPPDPPMILTPPLHTEPRPGAPHEPFLSHGPPPEDAWIAIETRQAEYRLVVRLPKFNRQSITIATRKRRILHIVADRWETGGGHFERRVSFGYDADLAQVRAEFDGEHLLIRVPRRLPPVYVTNPKPRLR